MLGQINVNIHIKVEKLWITFLFSPGQGCMYISRVVVHPTSKVAQNLNEYLSFVCHGK